MGRRGGKTAIALFVGALLTASLASSGAAADPGTIPSAATVAKAKTTVTTVAQQVGAMQAQLAVADAKLQSLGVAVGTAAEAYNGALYLLEKAQDVAEAAQRAADRAEADFNKSRDEVGRLAAATYRGGAGFDLQAVVTADSPEQLLAAANNLSILAGRQADVLNGMTASRVVADVLHSKATASLAEVTKAADAARQAKVALETRVNEQQSQVAGLTAQRAQLTAALAVATAKSTQLTQARKVGLVAEAARKRADAERKAREAAAHNGTHTGGSGASGGNSGGSSGGHATTAGAARAIAFAKAQLGEPYLWAATGPDRWDCSGLTMRAWETAGVSLPHWSVAQYDVSTKVSRSEARPGDLVFFGPDTSNVFSIHHVALYLGDGMMIEAPFTGSWVRISSVDSQPDLFGFARP